MIISGIYKIQSKIKPEKCYIGSSCNIYKRKRTHYENLRNNKHHSSKLQNHFNKYGESDLQFTILIACDKSDLIKHEQFYIDCYNPFFNICPIAGNNSGIKIPDDVRRKMSIAHRGRKKSKETKRRMSEAQKGNKYNLGRIWTEESKKKLSDSKKGKHPTQETVKKLKESHLGHIPWNKGMKGEYKFKRQPFSEEHKRKLSEAHKGKTTWNKGKKGIYSKESLDKMSKNNWKSKRLNAA